MQDSEHHGQHAANDGEVRRQPGRAGRTEDSTVHGGKEKGRSAALQHDACVRSLYLYLQRTFTFLSVLLEFVSVSVLFVVFDYYKIVIVCMLSDAEIGAEVL